MDVDNIPLGSDFVKVLSDSVSKCDVLLAVIGQRWLEARDAQGNRRLDDENDFVRVEIATALQRDIPVIPILVDGAEIPKAVHLPEDLQRLSTRNGLEVRHSSFRVDMDRLINGLRAQMGEANGPSIKPTELRSNHVRPEPNVLPPVGVGRHPDAVALSTISSNAAKSSSTWTVSYKGLNPRRLPRRFLSWILRNSNKAYLLEETPERLFLLDGNRITKQAWFFESRYFFSINDTKFDLIVEHGWYFTKSMKILADGIVIFEWKQTRELRAHCRLVKR